MELNNLFTMMLAQGMGSDSSGKVSNSVIQGFLWGGMLTKTTGLFFQGQEEKAVIRSNVAMIDMSLDVSQFKGLISKEQYARFRKKYSGTVATRVAKMGIEFTGSPIEVMNDAVTQINIDEAITNFQLQLQENQLLYERDIQKNAEKISQYSMYANIFNTIVSTATMAYAMGKGGTNSTGKVDNMMVDKANTGTKRYIG